MGTFIRRSVVSRQRVIFVSSSTQNIPDFDREFVVHVVDASEEGVGAFFGSAVLF